MSNSDNPSWINDLSWGADGLIPAIAQDANTGQVLMVAWMNEEALRETVATNRAVYWSRSRQKLWRKGEESGHYQQLISLHTDCDRDVLLLKIIQEGGIACHTGRKSCFYSVLDKGEWVATDPILKNPDDIYKK